MHSSFPNFPMRVRLFSVLLSAAILLPATAFALEGIGPRVTVTGTVQEVRITQKQKFNEKGGELIVKASNGQIVTVLLQDTVEIISEGRMSRRSLLPENIQPNMLVRIRGWRVDSKSLSAALVIIQNIQLNPALSLSGMLQSINGNMITVLSDDGKTRTLKITNETTISISYELTGSDALSLLNKQVLLTLNPDDPSLARIVRITGNRGVIFRK